MIVAKKGKTFTLSLSESCIRWEKLTKLLIGHHSNLSYVIWNNASHIEKKFCFSKSIMKSYIWQFKPLSSNPKKWSNKRLTILEGKGSTSQRIFPAINHFPYWFMIFAYDEY